MTKELEIYRNKSVPADRLLYVIEEVKLKKHHLSVVLSSCCNFVSRLIN